MTPRGASLDRDVFAILEESVFSSLPSLKTLHIACWSQDEDGLTATYPECEIYAHRLPSKSAPRSTTKKTIALAYVEKKYRHSHRKITYRGFEEVGLEDGQFVGADAPHPWMFGQDEIDVIKSCPYGNCSTSRNLLDCWEEGQEVQSERDSESESESEDQEGKGEEEDEEEDE